jgi:hypothetical protein
MVPGPEEVRGCTLVVEMCCRMQGCRFHGDLVGVYMDFMGFKEANGLYGIKNGILGDSTNPFRK